MEHYTEKQYDDDLTVVADEYDASFQTDNVDLFEFPTHDESPLARLKSLVLSIDWEITDEVLHQFNEELVDLKDVWADEKLYLVYIQALEKISKYIYKEKADAHPNAIKLLLSFYYNLEKMVSSQSMTEEDKRQLLLDDVRKFEILKKQIGRGREKATVPVHGELHADEMQPAAVTGADAGSILLDLKAIVFGIDWEISESELERLRDEVHRLEMVFAGSRPKQIFLQGLGTLAAYIRLKKSDAHADAFNLLHSFFAGLEKIVTVPMSLDEEKGILLPEVEKFNEFKAIVWSGGKADEGEEEEDADEEELDGPIAPALSGLPEEEERGFQEEEEAAALGLASPVVVEGQVDRFFTDQDEPAVEAMPADQPEVQADLAVPDIGSEAVDARLDSLFEPDFAAAGAAPAREEAMMGVDIESEADGDSDLEGPRYQADDLAPALSDLDETVLAEAGGAETEEHIEFAADVESRLDDFFGALDGDGEKSPAAAFDLEPEVAIPSGMQSAEGPAAISVDTTPTMGTVPPGVDVESEEDDESGEEPLALTGGDLAPALASEFEAEEMAVGDAGPAPFEPVAEVAADEEGPVGAIDETVDIDNSLDAFFGEEEALSQQDRMAVDFPPPEATAGLEAGEVVEELVFEPVEEGGGVAPGEPLLDPGFATVFEGVEEPVAAGDWLESTGEDWLEPVPEGVESGQPLAAALATAPPPEAQPAVAAELPSATAEDPLATLRACVDSLGFEMDDSIFHGLRGEIASLRHEYAAAPTAGAFLQLIATVGQHIESYRYESSAQAFNLLQSLTADLARALQDPHGYDAGETLLAELTAVLQWQQEMLDRQAVANGGRLTFAAPLRTMAGEIPAEEEISFDDDAIDDRYAAVLDPAVAAEPAGWTGTAMELTAAAEPAAAEADDLFAAEDLVVEMAEAQEPHAIDRMEDESGTVLADDLGAGDLARAGADDAGERLARQVRDLIRSEVESLRQEMQKGMESLRRDLLEREH